MPTNPVIITDVRELPFRPMPAEAMLVRAPEVFRPIQPGKERWPVKTGTDDDVADVAQDVSGQPFRVRSTVEDLVGTVRPRDMPLDSPSPSFQTRRARPVETTIFTIEAEVIACKIEDDGDFHIVIQGDSGEMMIIEIPDPDPAFVAPSSPWVEAIRSARAQVEETLQPERRLRRVRAPARITGVGFFDTVHGQTGVSQRNGIELHPVLGIEWLPTLPANAVTLRVQHRDLAVAHLPQARRFTRHRVIHPRRIIPVVPVGPPSPDPDPSAAAPRAAPLVLPPAAEAAIAAAEAAADDLVLARNVALGSVADNDTASHVGEPSVAGNGDVVFYTGNWYAAVSTDAGATFSFVDPFHAFPDPPGMGFCCDQVVQYIPKIDMFVWLLQYTQNQDGENIQRLAFANTDNVKRGTWQLFDISPRSLGLPRVFLDFPDLAVGENMLYVTTNGFLDQDWTASILVRLRLAEIAGGVMNAQHTISRDNFNFRVAQICGTRALWASHQDTSTLRVFSWDESATQPTFTDVTVASWAAGNFESRTPDGFNWLGRSDPRIVGATNSDSEVWFAWNANSGGANQRPHPYVQIARLRTDDFSVIDNTNIWDPDAAIAYPALSTNDAGEIGISYMLGGGAHFPTFVVGILTGARKDMVAVEGIRGPADGVWGDYLTIRRHHPNAKLFDAAGYALQNQQGSSDATPHFVMFGRARDVVAQG